MSFPLINEERRPVQTDHSRWLIWLVLVGSICFGLIGWYLIRGNLQKNDQARFDRLSKLTVDTVVARFNETGNLLYAARGLATARPTATPAEWSAYLRSLTPRLSNGVTGIGYIQRLPRGGESEFEAEMHAQGYPGYQIERNSNRPWVYAVMLIEPAETNAGVAGLDIGSGTTRRSAAEDAARNNSLTLSRRIRLKFQNQEVPGCLLLLPVYAPNAEISTSEQRSAALKGWVYASIRIDQLMEGIVASTSDQIDFEVFENDQTTINTMLFDADHHLGSTPNRIIADADYNQRHFNHRVGLDIHSRHWTINLSTTQEFDKLTNQALPWTALVGGLILGLFSAGLVRATTQARAKAVVLAEQMTIDLRRSEAEATKLALVASLTTNIVVLTDADWRITWVNDGFTRILGYAMDEALNQRPNELLRGPNTDRQTLIDMVRTGRAGKIFHCEILMRAKSGEDIWVELELQPVRDPHGEITGYMSVQQDITARKQAAAELLAAKNAAENANVAKSSFLAMMSHEIRTPMNGVIGMTSLLLDSPLTTEQREYAETIRVSGDSLLIIINDILDFSKIESGRLELEQVDFSLRECVEGSLDLLAARATEKHLDLLYEIEDSTPQRINGDPTRLRQILVNLLGNAVKFTDQGEVHLSLSARPAENNQVELEFSVRDTGIGIPLEAQKKLFQSFTQVDASTTRKFGGTGLGLAISKRLTELMGGRMWIESQPGEGTTFYFTIKAGILNRKPRLFVSEKPTNLVGRRVLLVDDNPMNLRILASLATKWGMLTQEAASGQAALDLLQTDGAFDAAILDMQMPDMDGATLAAAILRLPGLSKLPLVLLSSLGHRDFVPDHSLFAAYLTKPAKPAQIHHTLTQLLTGQNTPDESSLEVTSPTPVIAGEHLDRVLLAEDNTVNQRVALLMLDRLGYRADLAADGHEVLAAVQRQPYDIILMDVQMPGMDGLAATRKLVELYPEPNKRPWIIALTAGAMEGDRELCLQAGMDDYLTKPIKNSDLAAAMNRARPRSDQR